MSDAPEQTTVSVAKERFGGAAARVQAQRQGIVDAEFLTLRVPGYEDLQVRYRLLPEKQSEEIGRRVESAQRSNASNKKVMAISADLLVEACYAIRVRIEDEGEFTELVDDNDLRVRFGEEFAEFMGIPEFKDSRQLVLDVFSPEAEDGKRRNPDAITDHLNAIGLWRKGRIHEIDQALVGE